MGLRNIYFMRTFKQFLEEKQVKLYGLQKPPSTKLVSVVNPAKPYRPTFTGMPVPQVYAVKKST